MIFIREADKSDKNHHIWGAGFVFHLNNNHRDRFDVYGPTLLQDPSLIENKWARSVDCTGMHNHRYTNKQNTLLYFVTGS